MIATTPSDIKQVSIMAVNGDLIEAELWQGTTEKNLTDWEVTWKPYLQDYLDKTSSEDWPQNHHWNWKTKLENTKQSLCNMSFSIIANEMTQGMMIVDLTKKAKLPSQEDQHLVYIKYVATAPWNQDNIAGKSTRFRGCGSLLIIVAIKLSISEDFKGRIGLHSLPQSEKFYEESCGMTSLGIDEEKGNLRYFEFTPKDAKNLIEKLERNGK